jgi:hypothetical protein
MEQLHQGVRLSIYEWGTFPVSKTDGAILSHPGKFEAVPPLFVAESDGDRPPSDFVPMKILIGKYPLSLLAIEDLFPFLGNCVGKRDPRGR